MNKPRLQRLKWLFTSFPVYFLTACTHARQAILPNETTHNSFINFAKCASDREVMVGRYVIMPDHLHLFAAFGPHSPDLSGWAKALKGTLSKDFREAGMRVPYWQKGFFDHVMRSEESYEQKWEYVRQNPVRGGLVESADDWPFQGEIHPLVVQKL